jgi:hypothetical protein
MDRHAAMRGRRVGDAQSDVELLDGDPSDGLAQRLSAAEAHRRRIRVGLVWFHEARLTDPLDQQTVEPPRATYH